MKKLALIAAMAAFLFGANEPLNCDLNKKDCEVSAGGQKVSFSFYPKPLAAMAPLSLRVSGLMGDFSAPSVKIYGTGMDMGTITAPLEKRGSDYAATITLHSCVNPVMRWRAELFDGDKSLGISIDFDLKN